MKHEPNLKSDGVLREEILAVFTTGDRTELANLRVGVLNGIVHLAGVVSSLENWSVAAEIAEQVPGVRGVVNRIEAPGAPSPARTIHLDLTHTDDAMTGDDESDE